MCYSFLNIFFERNDNLSLLIDSLFKKNNFFYKVFIRNLFYKDNISFNRINSILYYIFKCYFINQ